MPPRLNLMSANRFLRVMPAYLQRSGFLGYKSFHGSMSEGVRYVIVLIREADGEIVALIDAAYLTALRTGATSGVAARHLAREDAVNVGVIGSGLEADTNLTAVAAVRNLASARVYSRNPDRRRAFARASSEKLGIEVHAVDSASAAVADSDIVIVATNTGMNGPVAYEGAWLEPGQLIISIGATSPFLREVDAETFDRADEVVFDAPPEQVFEESGDLLAVSEETRQRLRRGSRVLPDVVAQGPRAICPGNHNTCSSPSGRQPRTSPPPGRSTTLSSRVALQGTSGTSRRRSSSDVGELREHPPLLYEGGEGNGAAL